MKRWCFSIVVLLVSLAIAPNPAHAQEVRVASGEHSNFSRLVVAFRQKVEWTFGKVDGGYELQTNAGASAFQLAKVFDLIPRDRIEEVRDMGEGRLFLRVSCACYADAFQLLRGQVVLDIKDGTAPAEAKRFNQPLIPLEALAAQMQSDGATDQGGSGTSSAAIAERDQPAMSQHPEVAPLDISALESRRGLPLLPVFAPMLSGDTDVMVPLLNQAETTQTKPEAEEEAPQPNGAERVAVVEQELFTQISRGAAQGLLDANVTIPNTPDFEEKPAVAQEGTSANVPIESDRADAFTDTGRHVLIQTSIDQRLPAEEMPAGTTEQGFRCPAEGAFSVSSWGGDIRDGADLAKFRNGLVGEFDTPQPEAVLRLAKYLIYLTFGAEASDVLERYSNVLGDVSQLEILADIMDSQHSPQATRIAPFAECSGDVALWATLAQERLSSELPINESAVISAYSELPLHLRRHLGPSLIARLVDVGKTGLAHSLRNALSRGEDGPSPSLSYIEARLAMDDGMNTEATETLQELLQESAGAPQKIIQDLVELKLSQDIAISDEEIALLASFAFEQRGTDSGANLRALEVKALGQSGRFSEAFAKFDELEERNELAPHSKEDLETELAIYLVAKGTDAQFLRYLAPLVPQIRWPDAERLDIAERFFDLGFLSEAQEVLEKTATVPSERQRRLLANLAIKQGKFQVAIGYLSGLSDPQSVALRADALEGKDDIPGAISALEGVGASERLLQLTWRKGRWEEIAAYDSGAIGETIALLTDSEQPLPETENASVLKRDTALLNRSFQARKAISSLLELFPSL